MFKFFTREEIAEALTIVINAKSPNLKVELHNINECDDARTLWIFKVNDYGTNFKDIIALDVDETPFNKERSITSYCFDLAEVKGHELEIAEKLEWMDFNIYSENDYFLEEDGLPCEVSKDGDIIRVETSCCLPIYDEDVELISEQYHAQMPEKIKVKTIDCAPYPSKDNTITLERARKVSMKELLHMVKKILSDAEEKGILSEHHEPGDLVLEQIVINTHGTIKVFIGS